jgi:hypothetical protein
MERIVALTEKKELINKEALGIKKSLIDEITTIVRAYGVACFEDAKIRCINIHEGFQDNVEINFEVSFTDAEGNYVFASDISFDYDSRTKLLSINYGTCGRFNENNIYQFRRIQLLNKIVTNISMIQSRLQDVAEKASETYIKKVWEGYEIDVQIQAIKSSLKKAELIKITQNLKPGKKYQYKGETPADLRVYRYSHKPIIITKITPKLVFFTANIDGGMEYRCRKEAFVNHIYKEYLVAVD